MSAVTVIEADTVIVAPKPGTPVKGFRQIIEIDEIARAAEKKNVVEVVEP